MIGENQGMLSGHYSNKVKRIKILYNTLSSGFLMMRTMSRKDRKAVSRNSRDSAGANNLKWRKQVCKKTYYYIDMIAIEPALKGTGAFRKLIQPVLDRSENEGMPVLLDTHDKDNVPIYQHFGFEVAHRYVAKNDESLIQYAMIKV